MLEYVTSQTRLVLERPKLHSAYLLNLKSLSTLLQDFEVYPVILLPKTSHYSIQEGESFYVYLFCATLFAFVINPIQLNTITNRKASFPGPCLVINIFTVPFKHSAIYIAT